MRPGGIIRSQQERDLDGVGGVLSQKKSILAYKSFIVDRKANKSYNPKNIQKLERILYKTLY